MDIHFLYFEDCPSHESGLERLRDVMAQEQITAEIRITKVETEEQAAQWGFVGSPTILIDGKDMVPPPPDAPTALTCRVYQWDDGRFSPLPSPDMIRKALKQAKLGA